MRWQINQARQLWRDGFKAARETESTAKSKGVGRAWWDQHGVPHRYTQLIPSAPHYKAKRQNPFSGMAAFFGFGGSSAALQKSHKSDLNITDFSHADWAMLGQNKTTVLHPEVTEGPYYVSGEVIRKNVKDGQGGVDLHLDIQVIDMATCSPMPGVAVEVWSANATASHQTIPQSHHTNHTNTPPGRLQRRSRLHKRRPKSRHKSRQQPSPPRLPSLRQRRRGRIRNDNTRPLPRPRPPHPRRNPSKPLHPKKPHHNLWPNRPNPPRRPIIP